MIQLFRKEYKENYVPVKQLKESIDEKLKAVMTKNTKEMNLLVDERFQQLDATAKKMSSQKGTFGQVGEDHEMRSMKDKTHMEYFDTLINTLKIELRSEMNKIRSSSGANYSEDLNVLETSFKSLNKNFETLQADYKKLER